MTQKRKLKRIKHISPSSLSMYEKQPHKFYLQRCIDPPVPREPGIIAANIGTAFDVRIKFHVAGVLGQTALLENKIGKNFNQAIVEAVDEENKPAAALIHTEAAKIYEFYKLMMAMYPNYFVFHEVELLRQVVLVEGSLSIPTFCKGDASLQSKGTPTPFDWKVKGSAGKASIHTGWHSVMDLEGTLIKNKKISQNLCWQDIDSDIATQLVFTGWQVGHSTVEPYDTYNSIVHSLVCDYEQGDVKLVVYDAIISPYWQRCVKKRIVAMWQDLQTSAFYNRLENLTLSSFAAESETWW